MKPQLWIIPAQGIGDALLVGALAQQLSQSGFYITLFHRMATEIAPFFPTLDWKPVTDFSKEELPCPLLIENDHGSFAHQMHLWRQSHQNLPPVYFIFPKKSRWERPGDLLLDPKISFFHALSRAVEEKFQLTLPPRPTPKPPAPNRSVAIHPWSGKIEKNWRLSNFYQLGEDLKKRGFEPLWIMTPAEKEKFLSHYPHMESQINHFSSLSEIAAALRTASFFIGNDSGMGHLASFLGLHTLTLSPDPHKIEQWRPIFSKNRVLTPPFALPNFRRPSFPLRKWIWSYCVPVRRVIKVFLEHSHD